MSELVLRVLSDSEIEKLHEKTLELFENIGVRRIRNVNVYTDWRSR